MKNIIIFLSLFFFCIGQMSAQGFFKLNTNPENLARMPDPNTEMGVILSHDSPVVEIGGAEGKKTKGRFYAGTLIIASKETSIATWAGICGNTNFSTWWKPEGKIIYFNSPNSYKFECENMLIRMEKLQEGMDELLGRDYSGTLLELRYMLQQLQLGIEKNNTQPPLPSSWTTGNTVTGAGTLVGGLIGGFCFKDKKVETYTETVFEVVPGITFWTGDGTRQQTPDKIVAKEVQHERYVYTFSWTNFFWGMLSGFVLSWSFNSIVL